MQEKGNNNGQWWANQLLLALGGPRLWRQTGLRQLSGMLVIVFARTELEVSSYSKGAAFMNLRRCESNFFWDNGSNWLVDAPFKSFQARHAYTL